MKPERMSQRLLSITRSKSKMYEYEIPEKDHIAISRDPANLFPLAMGLLGDLAAYINLTRAENGFENELKDDLIFSAQFFDSFLQSRLREELNPYLLLLGSASYYLCDLPGSSKVLANRLGDDSYDLGGDHLEDLLRWLLQGNLNTHIHGLPGPYGKYINVVTDYLSGFTTS
ncbi:MAG: hypothetical protein HZC40_20360 [Chloroflexi bacterium]|nr:hypothetical protein [Chloroflexota bacterium]